MDAALQSAAAAVMEPMLRGVALVNGAAQTTCCGRLQGYMELASTKATASPVALAIGNEHGLCCLVELGLGRNWSIPIFSASKMLTGYVFLRLVQEGRLTLRTRAAELLSWWDAKGGGCHNVTVRHLLTQSGSMNMYPKGLGKCESKDLLGCAQEAYNVSCSGRPLGSGFRYAETNFFVLGAMALAATGLKTYDEVFRRYLAGPLGMSEACSFSFPSLEKADPGGGCRCSILDYGRFLRAAFADEIVPTALRKRAEIPETKLLGIGTGPYWWPWHYGIGLWRECPAPPGAKRWRTNATFGLGRLLGVLDSLASRLLLAGGDGCGEADAAGVKVSSIGIAGYYPWILRRGRQSHWGIIARFGMVQPQRVTFGMARDVVPMAAEAVSQLVPQHGSSAELPLPPGDGGELARVAESVQSEQRVMALTVCLFLCFAIGMLRGLCRLCLRCSRCCARCRKPGFSYAPIGSAGRGVPAQKIGDAAASEEEDLFSIA